MVDFKEYLATPGAWICFVVGVVAGFLTARGYFTHSYKNALKAALNNQRAEAINEAYRAKCNNSIRAACENERKRFAAQPTPKTKNPILNPIKNTTPLIAAPKFEFTPAVTGGRALTPLS